LAAWECGCVEIRGASVGVAVSKSRAMAVGVLVVAVLVGGSLGCSGFEKVREAASRVAGMDAETATVPNDGGIGPSGTPSSGEMVGEAAASPELGTAERLVLAYPPVSAGGTGFLGANRGVSDNVAEWPEMKYLGEDARIGGVGDEPVSVAPVEIRIVEGSSIPLSYSPELDITRPEPDGSAEWIRGRLDRPVMVIPPNASLVMVRLETEPSVGSWASAGVYMCPDGEQRRWNYAPTFFRLAYPGIGETPVQRTGDEFWFGEYQDAGYGCPGNGWLYFIVPGVDLEPLLLWLEYAGSTAPGELAFWTLSGRP